MLVWVDIHSIHGQTALENDLQLYKSGGKIVHGWWAPHLAFGFERLLPLLILIRFNHFEGRLPLAMSFWVWEAFSPHPHHFLSLRETPTPSRQSLCLSTRCICVLMFLCCSGFDKRARTFQKQFREFLKTRENILSLLRRSVTENPSGFYPYCVFCSYWEGQWLKTLLDFILVVCYAPVEKWLKTLLDFILVGTGSEWKTLCVLSVEKVSDWNASGFYPCCVFCPCWEGQWLKRFWILSMLRRVVDEFSSKVSEWKPFWTFHCWEA